MVMLDSLLPNLNVPSQIYHLKIAPMYNFKDILHRGNRKSSMFYSQETPNYMISCGVHVIVNYMISCGVQVIVIHFRTIGCFHSPLSSFVYIYHQFLSFINHFISLILLLIAQDIGGIRRDGGCGLNEAIWLFLE